MFRFRPLFLIVLVLLLFGSLSPTYAASTSPLLQADPGTPPAQDFGTLLAALIAPFSATVAGMLEFTKRAFIAPVSEREHWDDNKYRIVVNSLALLLSLLVALVAGPKVDVFRVVGITSLPPIFGILIAGVLIYVGNDITHNGVNGLQGLVGLLRAKVDAYASAASVPPALLSPPIESTPIAPLKFPGGWKTYIGDEDFEAFVDGLAETLAARASPTAPAAGTGSSSGPSPSAAPA